MKKFDKPEFKITDYKIKEMKESEFYARFEIEPLERGFGLTLGNALRRVLLSSLPGSAIRSVKIDGVLHEFQTMDGVIEDVVTIILNLKKVAIKNYSKDPKRIYISKSEEGEVKASDIKADADIEILNPELVICHLAKGGSIEMEMVVDNGRGYVTADENKELIEDKEVGVIITDTNYSPIERVAYEVVKTRVGQDETYDKLILDVYTNGTMKPEEAVSLASKILIDHFKVLMDLSNISDSIGFIKEDNEEDNESSDRSLEELDLPPRALNALTRSEYKTIGDITDLTLTELKSVRNLGEKSLLVILEKLEENGLSLKEDE